MLEDLEPVLVFVTRRFDSVSFLTRELNMRESPLTKLESEHAGGAVEVWNGRRGARERKYSE